MRRARLAPPVGRDGLEIPVEDHDREPEEDERMKRAKRKKRREKRSQARQFRTCPDCEGVYSFNREKPDPTCPFCRGQRATEKFILTWGKYKVVRVVIAGAAWAVNKWKGRG